MPALLRKLRTFGLRDAIDLFRAQAALLRARRLVATRPVGSLAIRAHVTPESLTGDPERAHALALATRRAARFGLFRPYCLVQAIALRDLLEADGIRGSSIRVGVRRNGGTFEAHAWVTWGRHLLGDRPEHVRRFTEVDDLRVLGGR